jgi:hypothetical protein
MPLVAHPKPLRNRVGGWTAACCVVIRSWAGACYEERYSDEIPHPHDGRWGVGVFEYACRCSDHSAAVISRTYSGR